MRAISGWQSVTSGPPIVTNSVLDNHEKSGSEYGKFRRKFPRGASSPGQNPESMTTTPLLSLPQ
jgi:hypothetical protein